MAHSLNVIPILQGKHKAIYHIGIVGDGSSPDLNREEIVIPSDFGLDSSARMVIELVEYNFTGFDGRLEYDSGLVDANLIWSLSRDISCNDFSRFGGIKDQSGLDGTGKILFSTSGLDGGVGSMVLCVRSS